MWVPKLGDRRGPLYRIIAAALVEDIQTGRLPAGTRLPTHRELAERVGVTVGTITRAYAEVERQGLVGGEVGRGTFVRGREKTRFPPPVAESEEGGVVNLELNWPVPAAGQYDATAFERTLAEIAKSPQRSALLAYQPHVGLAAHRAAGAQWMGRQGLAVSAGQVTVCSGAQHAMEVALAALTRPGDTLLTEALTYPGVKKLAERLQLRLQGVAMDAEGLRPDALEAACRGDAKVLYVIPTHQNPTGAVMSEERRRKLAAVVKARKLAVVEDDAYGLLLEKRPRPLAHFAPEHTYFIAGTSKLLSPGLRIAYLAAPEGKVEALSQGIWMTTWMAAPLSAELATRWISDGTADELVLRRRREASWRFARAQALLGKHLPRAVPGPALHLWLPLPGRWRADAFAAQARRAGVAVGSAELFAVPPHAFSPGVRVCLGPPTTRERFEEGLRRLVSVLEAGPESIPSIV
ncbi:PLP-dependent aminotransferase family protein [Aggregicoccus sp. 17bor-14]|uniref:MocR-like ectoine utilization transcription factor EhuR n=1 Tax=Myxococcaceae TaxID=31 RepID=UPI00129C9321|nr:MULTISPECIES: PLP-dependent aminotransferase family protein [Myxococcaceae]MBF5045088.1 PLP-dependent aminotransferase family protein [Simulacricoccus sp. 17bor-14]MRI90830.1 PLP-dependent aminotransferase family protein [Aggregicoccus sp. 17bor-14]